MSVEVAARHVVRSLAARVRPTRVRGCWYPRTRPINTPVLSPPLLASHLLCGLLTVIFHRTGPRSVPRAGSSFHLCVPSPCLSPVALLSVWSVSWAPLDPDTLPSLILCRATAASPCGSPRSWSLPPVFLMLLPLSCPQRSAATVSRAPAYAHAAPSLVVCWGQLSLKSFFVACSFPMAPLSLSLSLAPGALGSPQSRRCSPSSLGSRAPTAACT